MSRFALGEGLVLAIGLVLAVFAATGCSQEAGDLAEDNRGAALITLVAPPEANDLDPLASGVSLRLRRGVPGGGLEDLDVVLRGAALRAEPYEGEQPTRFVVELRQGDVMLARAETAVAVLREDEPDREMVALLVPPKTLVTPVSADGAALLPRVGPGASVTALGDGRIVVAGGALDDAGSPCAPSKPKAIAASAKVVDLLALTTEAEVTLVDARADHAAVPLLGGRVALLGGYVAKAGTIGLGRGVEIVAANQGRSEGASFELARGRARAGVVADGAQIVLVGGDEEAVGAPVASIERFDLGLGTVGTGSLALPRRDPDVALVREPGSERRLLFVLGGVDASGNSIGQGEVFELQGDAFWPVATIVGPTPAAASAAWLGSEQPFTALRIGGLVGGAASDAVLQWSPQSGSWSPTTALAVARSCIGVGAFDGELWLVGGLAADGTASSAVERRGGELSTWDLGAGRVRPAVLPGPGPHLLLAGGRDAQGAAAGVQLYWPY